MCIRDSLPFYLEFGIQLEMTKGAPVEHLSLGCLVVDSDFSGIEAGLFVPPGGQWNVQTLVDVLLAELDQLLSTNSSRGGLLASLRNRFTDLD